MKKTAEIIIADRNAMDYFCRMTPVQAKKVLFAMDLLKGDQRLGDSKVAEVRRIAGFYDGVINAAYAREMAAMLAVSYSNIYPGTLLTKKKAETYTDARYRKLYDVLGLYGFDYVITALGLGKAYVMNPENGIEEKHMLNALRWDERREGVDAEISNDRHHRKGIQLVGLGDMMEVLLPYTFIIASVYELVMPGYQNVPVAEYDEDEEDNGDVEMTKADMVADFIDNAHLLKDIYGTSKPVAPEGIPEEELREGTLIYALAKKNKLDDSEAVLKYVEDIKKYESCQERLGEVFTDAEVKLITEKAETVQEILRLVDSL